MDFGSGRGKRKETFAAEGQTSPPAAKVSLFQILPGVSRIDGNDHSKRCKLLPFAEYNNSMPCRKRNVKRLSKEKRTFHRADCPEGGEKWGKASPFLTIAGEKGMWYNTDKLGTEQGEL